MDSLRTADSLLTAKRCSQVAWNKKASDIVIIDVSQKISVTDYFVICSGESNTHIDAIADAILDYLDKSGISHVHSEGYKISSWVLIDAPGVVVHIFNDEKRRFYNIENLWADCRREKFARRKINLS